MNQESSTLHNLALHRFRAPDFLRGAVMVLMAIDHVRVYSGIPAGGPSPGIFFTRWITHFCAPSFVFLAGVAAFLYGIRINDKRKLAKYLITRGLLLVILELTLIRFFWTFNLNFQDFMLAGVIWMLGWCMVLLPLFIWLRPVIIAIAGLTIIFLQPLFAMLPGVLPQSAQESFGRFWEFIYSSGLEGPPGIAILYVLVPWIGVMAAGYGFGQVLLMEAGKRKKICLRIGISAILIFIIAGSAIIYSQGPDPESRPFIFRLLNQNKYPASALFLLMTLGPLIALVPFAEKVKGKLADAISVIGSVPMLYYLLHILLIHLSALLVNLIIDGTGHSDWYNRAPFTFIPEENRWGLPLLYLVFLIDVILLYFLCRWYARYKFAHPEIKWLKYL